jgi:hypothetical protein
MELQMSRKRTSLLQFTFILASLLAACSLGGEVTAPPTGSAEVTEVMTEVPALSNTATGTVTEAQTAATTEPTAGTLVPGEATTLVSISVDHEPTLDGVAGEAAWENAQPATIPVAGGANNGATKVSVRSVYTADRVYFLVTWEDPSESWLLVQWEKQPDSSWIRLNDPNDQGGDNNEYHEDKLAFIWPINHSVPGFESTGCFVACHAGEVTDQNPYGTKYLNEESQMADVWHWKSVRNLNQVDDGYLDSSIYSGDSLDAGLHPDPKTVGGYVNNETEDQTMPAFMPPNGGNNDGSPGYILDEEKAPFDDSLFQAGDRLPGIVKSAFRGDRGNLSAGWTYEDGKWTLELGRDLETGSEFDLQFDDLGGTYYFGVAAFDNTQVRHGFQTGATAFTFQPK